MSVANLANYYTKDDENISVNGGGTLYAHAERQTYGSLSSSGVVRKVKFYVYAKYSGTKTRIQFRRDPVVLGRILNLKQSIGLQQTGAK
ncbi:hypothetical protein [Eubacterium oxidoreducens]|uniref:Uncharacterized protein n=1 Tax=Eubacterium oxidoreducens TaxID=1732 RepID=A0A1G6ALD0_EUBOX|nr:hypothetical protein [Eubacterium oxidoreducens]SDB08933.1 hypothetical protein SAMN02910417_00636 [Eubacterium oxidoreducens]